MNQLTWLEHIVDKEKQRLSAARRVLEKNPASYSARVALQSSEYRLIDLKKRLKTEKANHAYTTASSRSSL